MDRLPSLAPVLAVNFIATLGFSVVIPFLVFVVYDFGGNPVVYGLVGAAYPAMQLVGAPVLGRWSDDVGRRWVLLISQGGTLIAWCVFAGAFFVPMVRFARVDVPILGAFDLTLPLVLVFAARALDGLTGGNIAVANAYVADLSDDRTRTRNFGRMGASSNLGFVLGPALASGLGALGAHYLVAVGVCIAVSLAATLMIAFALPESRPESLTRAPNFASLRRLFGQGHRNCIDASRPAQPPPSELLAIAGLRPAIGLYFLVFLAFNFFYTAFPSHAVVGLGWQVADTGLFFSLLSGLMILVQGPILERLSDRWSPTVLIVAGNLLLALNFGLLSLSTSAATYGAAIAFAAGNGLMWPSLLALLAQLAGGERQGAVQGLAGSVGSFASILGLLVGGALYVQVGTLTFGISAGVMVGSTLLLRGTRA